MALPNVLSKLTTKEKPQEQFLAIEIGSETVTTAVWKIVKGQTQIVSIGTTQDWEIKKDSIDPLLTAIDVSLEKTLKDLTQEPNKVIFGLQETWVEGKTVSKKYAKLLKQITEKFEFEPVGFVVTTEALIHLLKLKEGTPPTAILILVNESEIQVTIVNLGKVIGSQTVSRSEDIGADVEEGLARFKVEENLPSRMLLLNSTLDLESLKQDLLSYDWQEKLPFLHFPKVEILEKQITIKAVAIAGGAEAAKALGFEIIEEQEEEQPPEAKEEVKKDVSPEPQELKPAQPEPMPSADSIGFRLDTDITKEIPEKKEFKEDEPQPKEPIKKEQIKKIKEEEESEPAVPIRETFSSKLTAFLSAIPRTLIPPKLKLPHIGGAFESRTKLLIITILILLVLTLAAVIYGYWTVPKAEVVLYVKPRTLDKELVVTIDPTSNQIITTENLIPGKIVGLEQEGEKQKDTTGTKLVGENAKGEVTIYNKTSAAKAFPAGTMIVGPNNLVFSLDNSVTVASASSQESDEAVTTVFGKSKAPVTASAIGAEYNLAANADFKFKEFSTASYDAKNEQEFTGGSSREVQAITEEDIDTLLDELKQELKTKAAQDLESQEGPGTKVLVDGAQTEILSSELSGEAGDEAQKVTAKIKVKITTLAYEEENYNEILEQSISEAIPADFKLKQDESLSEVRDVEFVDEIAKITIVYKAVLIPRINEEDIKRELRGKYPGLVQEYLESLPNFSKAEVKITPAALPARLKTFPRKADNITIEIKVETND